MVLQVRPLVDQQCAARAAAAETEQWVTQALRCPLHVPRSYWDCPDAHLPVLQDAPYQAAWGRALEVAAPLLQGAVVLDIGCGIGTLAMAAAQVCVCVCPHMRRTRVRRLQRLQSGPSSAAGCTVPPLAHGPLCVYVALC